MSDKTNYEVWYHIGFTDGKKEEHLENSTEYWSQKKPGYKEGLAAGKIQRKKDILTNIVLGENQ